MNKKDIAEIRRRLNPESQNPIEICGCYVNGKRAVVSSFRRSLMSLTQSESEKYMSLFKRVLSGDIGKNLSLLQFPTDEIMDGETHARLMALNQTALCDADALNRFFEVVIENTQMEGNYLVLLMHDTYDTPFRSSSESAEASGADSEAVFQYLLCAVCPVKPSKGALSYSAPENDFVSRDPDWVVNAPDMGFLFPAYEDGGPNIHSALYYTRDLAEMHTDFVTAALAAAETTPAAEKKESFKSLLKTALEDECNLEVVEAVNDHLINRLEEQKSDREAEPACVNKREVREILNACGVSEERQEAFERSFDEEFGLGSDLPAAAIADDRQFEVRTPDVVVRVSPDRAGLIETRVIDGTKYILIRADEGVQVNGVDIGF